MPESTATYSDGSARVEATGHARMQALGEKDRQDAVSAGIVKGAGDRAAEALAPRQDAPQAGQGGAL